LTAFLVALTSGLIMVWSLFQLLRHKLNESRMGMAIYARLRRAVGTSRLLRAIVREPLLGLTREAAHLEETRSMMRSYWMSGLYGLIFIVSLMVFAGATGLLTN
jgi:hypothetical protein